MDKWYTINERMPEPETKVLIYIADCHFIGLDIFSRNDPFNQYEDPQFRTYGSYVTHWMPLPDEPG